jgi:hypothetical protein
MTKAKKPKLTFEDRVNQILNGENGRSISGSLEEGFVVTNEKGEQHEVQMQDDFIGTCDCMNFRIEGRSMEGFHCKHIEATCRFMEKAVAQEEFQSVHYP